MASEPLILDCYNARSGLVPRLDRAYSLDMHSATPALTLELRRAWTRPEYVRVASIREASETVRRFVMQNDLTADNYRDAAIYRANAGMVARVSYNGRAWTMSGLPLDLDADPATLA